MDGQRFDAITRSLATAASRRRVLRGLAAGAAGALGAAVGLRRAGGQETCTRDPGDACFGDEECCGGAVCARPQGRTRGKCVCPPGTAAVGGTCACPPTCPAGQVCGTRVDPVTFEERAGCCVPPGGTQQGECNSETLFQCCDVDPSPDNQALCCAGNPGENGVCGGCSPSATATSASGTQLVFRRP